MTTRSKFLVRLLLGAVVCGLSTPTTRATPLAPASPRAASAPASSVDVGPLRLGELLDSVERHFPVLLAAREDIAIADGALLSASGLFDVRFRADAKAEILGFYETEKLNIGASQPTTLEGLELSGGYRIGRGNFAVWDKAQQTNDAGELRLGVKLPLLRGRDIDERRVELWRARLERERVEPQVATAVLGTRLDAALSFWRWVAAGERLRVAEQLLRLAADRQSAMQAGVEEGLLARIELADNERLIAERQAIRIQAERELERQAIALSLYLRDETGEPQQPSRSRLPVGFPQPPVEPLVDPDESLRIALAQRPELRELELTRRQMDLAVRKARNDTLPRFDLRVDASQDFGAAANNPDDKGEFVLRAGLTFSAPVQRRVAHGTLQKRQAELAQLDQQLRLQRDAISVEVRDTVSAKIQAMRRIEEARRSVELALEVESAERFQLNEGNSDLLRLNIRERQTAQDSAFLVGVMQEYFEAWTRYQVVLGNAVDPERLIPATAGSGYDRIDDPAE